MNAEHPPPHHIHVRSATLADYDGLCPLFAELDLFHRLARPDFFQAAPEPVRSREFIGGLVAGPGTAILIAEAEAPVGLAILRLHEMGGLPIVVPRRIVIVDNIVVAERARRRGVGRALLRGTRDWALTQSAAYVEIAVHEFNRGAIAFYESAGYQTSTRRLMAYVTP